ncbi:MAG: MCE family protein [Flavobacteriales bacterium]|nr:MCE family protein [Flavobacteriales bacterium]
MGISREFKIGAIMIAAIAALIVGVQYLKGNDIFNRSRTFYGIYNNVAGLAEGSPVTINGLQVGQVKSIRFIDSQSGNLLVTFVVTNRDIEFSRDSKAHLQSPELMGGTNVAILFGTSSALAQNGDTLITSAEQGIVEAVNAQIAPLRAKTENMVASIDSVMTVMEVLLREDARPNLEKSFVSIRKTLESLENTSNKLSNIMESESSRLASIFKNVESITANLEANNDELTTILENFASISDTLAKADIANIMKETADAIASTSSILGSIERGEGSMGMLLNNDSLYNNLQSAADNLDALLEDIRVHPRRYVSFSLIQRKEKQLKLTKKEVEQLQEILGQ